MFLMPFLNRLRLVFFIFHLKFNPGDDFTPDATINYRLHKPFQGIFNPGLIFKLSRRTQGQRMRCAALLHFKNVTEMKKKLRTNQGATIKLY